MKIGDRFGLLSSDFPENRIVSKEKALKLASLVGLSEEDIDGVEDLRNEVSDALRFRDFYRVIDAEGTPSQAEKELKVIARKANRLFEALEGSRGKLSLLLLASEMDRGERKSNLADEIARLKQCAEGAAIEANRRKKKPSDMSRRESPTHLHRTCLTLIEIYQRVSKRKIIITGWDLDPSTNPGVQFISKCLDCIGERVPAPETLRDWIQSSEPPS